MSKTTRAAILEAIELFGSERKLGDAIGFAQHSVWRAKTIGRVSPRMASAIEAATRGKIKRINLCPKVFGPPVRKRPTELRAAS
jgi:DNA-binding transcriptional regulator YdaS (Cro superfamily)